MSTLRNLTIAFLTANEGVEQVELTAPWHAVEAAGGNPVLVSPKAGEVQAYHHLDKGDTFQATVSTAHASAEDYAALVLPGGVSNPDQLRIDPTLSRSSRPSSTPASRSPSSAMAPGPSSRPTWSAAAG